jgi:hypothetical protein
VEFGHICFLASFSLLRFWKILDTWRHHVLQMQDLEESSWDLSGSRLLRTGLRSILSYIYIYIYENKYPFVERMILNSYSVLHNEKTRKGHIYILRVYSF